MSRYRLVLPGIAAPGAGLIRYLPASVCPPMGPPSPNRRIN